MGLTKEETLPLLDDPIPIWGSDEKGRTEPDTPFEYTFDNDFGGVEFTLHFEHGRVARLEMRGFG